MFWTRCGKQIRTSGGRNIAVLPAVFLCALLLAGGVALVWHAAANRARDREEKEALAEQAKAQGAGAETQAAEPEQTSIGEVVRGRTVDSVPKSVRSYDFEEEPDGVQPVIRSGGEQMPEDADVALQYVEGIDGKALYLDGTYGLRLDGIGRLGASYSAAFWIKADELCDWSPFIHIGYDLFDSERRCRLWIGQKTDGSSVAPILSSEQARDGVSFEIRPDGMADTMQTDAWYHIVFTVDGTKTGSRPDSVYGTLYVSGVMVGEGDVARDVLDAGDPEIYLGINCWDELFPAAYDDVRIWDRALDESQVWDLYDAYYQTDGTAAADETVHTTWKDAYLEYLREISAKKYVDENTGGYQLVNIDGDAVPELFIESGQMAYGSMLCTYANDQVQAEYLSSMGFSYIEGENLFRDFMGHMDAYHDIVYSLTHGKFMVQGHGEYGAADNSDVQFDADGEPIYEYYWNDVPVTREEYDGQLAAVYDESRATDPGDSLCSYQDIKEKIENY